MENIKIRSKQLIFPTLLLSLITGWLAMTTDAGASTVFSQEERDSFSLASQALRQGDLDSAETRLQQLKARLPGRPEILNNLGVIAERRGNRARAAELFAAAQVHPYYLSVHNNARRMAWVNASAETWVRATEADPFQVIEDLPASGQLAADLASVRAMARQPSTEPTWGLLGALSQPGAADVPSPGLPIAVPQVTTTPDSATRVSESPWPEVPVTTALTNLPQLPLPQAVELWRQAWQRQDIGAYLAWYAPDFSPAMHSSKQAWESKRRAVFRRPKASVTLRFDALAVQSLPDGQAVSFEQSYRAPNHADHGRKTMHWRVIDGQWRIASESFVPHHTRHTR